MKLSVFKFDGTEINDTTNYVSKIPFDIPLQAAQAKGMFIRRAGAYPVLSGTELSESYITLLLTCKGTVSTQLETVNQLFNVYDETPKQLIIKDTDDSDKQYYIYCVPRNISPLMGVNTVRITLSRESPIWQSVTQNSQSWTITTVGDSEVVANGGNIEAYPIFQFTPTSYPGAGYGYSRKVGFYPTSSYAWSNRPVEILGGLDTAALVNDTTVSNQINQVGGINAAVTTIPIDTSVGGGLATTGIGYVDTEQIKWTGNSGGNLTGVTRGYGGTTAATHADNAVISRSLTIADGRDFVVMVNGVKVNRWFGESGTARYNQSATLCWIVLNVPAKREVTLKTAIANTGTPTYIDVNLTAANTTAMNAMPTEGYLLINSEEWTYSRKVITATQLRFVVDERSVRNTSIAAHAVDDTIRWVPFDIQVAYNNPSAKTPATNDTKKPVINMATSTNASFVYADFYDTADPKGQRAGSWIPSLISTAGGLKTESKVYFGTNLGADTNPAEVAGMKISTYISSGLYRAESAQLEWRGKFPDGVSEVTSNGSKYRTKVTWATVARLQSSVTGTAWIDEWAATEATPASATTWTTWTHNSEAVPNTTRVLRFYMKGVTTAVSGNYYALEVTGATITLVNYPTVSLRAVESNYFLEATITNSTTGDYITIEYPLQTNKTLTIDTDPNQPYARLSGQLVNVVNPDTTRSKWLALDPGNNTLVYSADAASNITCVVKWRDRMNFG